MKTPLFARIFSQTLFALLLLGGCETSHKQPEAPKKPPELPAGMPSAEELFTKTPPSKEDEALAGVFSALDGRWQGEFRIYTHAPGQLPAHPPSLDPKLFAAPPYKLSQTIAVEQEYTSQGPYFQEVSIRDTYTDAAGQKKSVESTGVNKIQDGRLWCVVKKPDETVVHTGTTRGEDTILWQRDIRAPLKIEYFEETVRQDTYTIVGWGYYGKDDPTLGPRTFFYGVYHRPGANFRQ